MKNLTYIIGLIVFIWAITKPMYDPEANILEIALYITILPCLVFILKKMDFFKTSGTNKTTEINSQNKR